MHSEGKSSERVRGYCHLCCRELIAEAAGDDEYRCTLCNAVGCVEMVALGDFQRWAGTYTSRYDDGHTARFVIDADGILTLGNSSTSLVWVGDESFGDIETHLPVRARGHCEWNVVEYMCLESDGSIDIQRTTITDGGAAGPITRGRAQVEVVAADVSPLESSQSRGYPQQPQLVEQQEQQPHRQSSRQLPERPDMFDNPQILGSAMVNFFTGFSGAMQNVEQRSGSNGTRDTPELARMFGSMIGAFQQGMQHATQNTPGMSERDRTWVEHFNSTVSAQGMSVLHHAGPMMQYFEQHLGANWQNQRSGADEAAIRTWVDEHTIPADVFKRECEARTNSEEEGDTWTCPICHGEHDPDEDGICLLCDGDGAKWHVFHKQCAYTWLCHNNSCPICRRSPAM